MDLGTLVVTALFLAVVILPFAFLGKKYRKQKKQLVRLLNQLASQNQETLLSYDICGNFGLGIDQSSRHLYFVRMIQDEMTSQVASLEEISRCKINTSSRILEEGEKRTEHIGLVLYHRLAQQPPVLFELYNAQYDSLTLNGELQVAAKWEQITTDALSALKEKKRSTDTDKQVVFV